MNSPDNRRFLDSAYARIVALGCFALSVSALAYVHRDDLLPQEAAPVTLSDDSFSRCFRDGTASIDKMLAEQTIGEDQAKLFRLRAEARCRAQTGTVSGPPGGAPPGLPPVR